MFGKSEKKAEEVQTIPAQKEGSVRMVIDFFPGSEGCQVSGPLAKPSLCYSMLEMARDVIHGFSVQSQARKQTISAPPPGFDPSKLPPVGHS